MIEGPKKTIRQAQQELAQNCGFEDEIIWDLLRSDEGEIMKNKIKQLIPDQEKGQKQIVELRNNIFTSVWNQRKYTNKASVSYIFYVMVTKDENFNTAADSTQFSCHPVFRCRKCEDSESSRNCCMIYVDETGRVYQNWDAFIKGNVLPAGTMVVPRRGIYNFNSRNEVILDFYCTPNGSPEAKAMSLAQKGSSVLGLGTACVPLAALAIPVAAPVMAAAGIVGLGVGAFTAITSVLNLKDRKKHEQSICVTNSAARASYIGVAGGAVGIAAAASTRVLTSMAAAGKATAGIELFVNGVNISSIVLSGSGVASGVLDMIFKIQDGDDISKLDILQLSASLVLFTHSVYNFQLASKIVNNARNNSIRSYRESLSNRQRKMFDKLSKETVRIRGSTQGKMDIIRGINEIPDRQYLNDLFKVNKQLNQNKVRPAFAESGGRKVVLNNELPVDTASLRQNLQHQKGTNILEQVNSPIPTTHNSDTYTTQTTKAAQLFYTNADQNIKFDPLNELNNIRLALALPNGSLLFLQDFGIKFIQKISDGCKFEEVILSMAENLCELTVKYLIKLAQVFIEQEVDGIQRVIRVSISTESVLFHILIFVVKRYGSLAYEFLSKKGDEIKSDLKKYFLSFNSNNSPEKSKSCPHCWGRFSICSLD